MQVLIPDLAEREIFMCGPEGFMKAARAMAREVSVAAIHEESFGEKIISKIPMASAARSISRCPASMVHALQVRRC
jgi:ferredoxin-NADP reductase